MNWLNIETATLRSEQYIGSEPQARATWLNVLGWCCEQENNGRIVGAASWGDRRWQQTCGVTKTEVSAAPSLLTWDGSDLVVWNYPSDKQAEVQAKRNAGHVGGLRSAAAKAERKIQAQLEAEVEPKLEAQVQADAKQSVNGREGKGKERKENGMEDGQNGSAQASPASVKLSDADWIAGLSANPAFDGLDVKREHQKMMAWCDVNRKQPSRRRFINWLNRADRPMAGGKGGVIVGTYNPGKEADGTPRF